MKYFRKKSSNWYKRLKKIDEEDPIVQINIYGDDYNVIGLKFLEDARKDLDYDFYSGYGASEGPDFTAWTKKMVYFPMSHDGSEWIECVPRNPCDIITDFHSG